MNNKGRAQQVCPPEHGPRAITAYVAARRHMKRSLRFDSLTLQALGAKGGGIRRQPYCHTPGTYYEA